MWRNRRPQQAETDVVRPEMEASNEAYIDTSSGDTIPFEREVDTTPLIIYMDQQGPKEKTMADPVNPADPAVPAVDPSAQQPAQAGKSFWEMLKKVRYNYIMGFLCAFGTVYYATHDIPKNKAEADANFTAVEMAKQRTAQEKIRLEMMRVAAASGGRVAAPAIPVDSTPQQAVKSTTISAFSCFDETERRQGFASATPYKKGANEAVTVNGPGCAVVSFGNATPTSFQGSGEYLLSVPAGDLFHKCGTIDLDNNYGTDCMKLMKEHEVVRIYLHRGARVTIN